MISPIFEITRSATYPQDIYRATLSGSMGRARKTKSQREGLTIIGVGGALRFFFLNVPTMRLFFSCRGNALIDWPVHALCSFTEEELRAKSPTWSNPPDGWLHLESYKNLSPPLDKRSGRTNYPGTNSFRIVFAKQIARVAKFTPGSGPPHMLPKMTRFDKELVMKMVLPRGTGFFRVLAAARLAMKFAHLISAETIRPCIVRGGWASDLVFFRRITTVMI